MQMAEQTQKGLYRSLWAAEVEAHVAMCRSGGGGRNLEMALSEGVAKHQPPLS